MSYIFGKLMHQRLILAIRKPFWCILRGVRFLLANRTLISTTSQTFSYLEKKNNILLYSIYAIHAEALISSIFGPICILAPRLKSNFQTTPFSTLVHYEKALTSLRPHLKPWWHRGIPKAKIVSWRICNDSVSTCLVPSGGPDIIIPF